jgi:hypothetical protein
MNDSIGTLNASLVVDGVPEVVIPSDWYMSSHLPTDYDGNYWPSGSIQHEFLFPGSDHNRPLRKPNWSNSYGTPSMYN